MLTVAYAIFPSSGGSGDDDQVLLQYDTSGWERFARPLDPHRPHRIGPSSPAGKFFVRTGNTTWGVQNLEYDCASERWLLAVYAGRKPQYPNFTLFAVDAGATPRAGYVPDAEDGRGMRLRLSGDGIRDAATWIRGWRQDASVGLESVGGGVFYLASHSEHAGLQSGDAELVEWAEDSTWPLQPVGHPARAPGCPSGP